MPRLLTLAALAVAFLLSAVAPAGAITNGQPDTAHPYVGMLVTVLDGGVKDPVCTGTLIAPRVFLTAAHCTAYLEENDLPAFVTFGPNFDQGSPLVAGTPVTHPDWNPLVQFQDPNTHDIAVVLLASPVTNLGYATLPALGRLDPLATRRGTQTETFTIVGYGSDGLLTGGGPPGYSFQYTRSTATASLVSLRSQLTDGYNLQLTSSPGKGQGGVCFGDSGGPVFLATSNTIVGIISSLLNFTCTGGAFAFRTDTSETVNFLAPYL